MPRQRSEQPGGLPRLGHPRFRGPLTLLIGNGILQAAVAAGNALVVGRGFDRLFQEPPARAAAAAGWIALGFGGLLLLGAALTAQERTLSERLGQSYVHRVRLSMFDHLQRMSGRAHASRRRGGLLMRLTHDLGSLRLWISRGLIGGGVSLAVVAGGVLALAALSPTLALVVVVLVAAGALGSARIGRSLRRRAQEVRSARTRLANDVEERLGRIAVVQAFGQTRRERRRVSRRSREVVTRSVDWARVAGRHRALGEVTAGLATLAVLLVGSFEVHRGSATAGAAVAALVVSRLLRSPMRRISKAHEYWHRGLVARERIEGFFALPAPIRDHRKARPLPAGRHGAIALRKVSFQRVLRRADAEAPEQSRVLLSGPNGAGKSTVIWLLAGLARPDRGRIVIDGRRLDRCALASLRREVGIVAPDLPLLRGTVRRNLCYRWPRAPQEEVRRVVERVRLDEVLPDLDARVADGGANLSNGQRQRLGLARALVGSPRLLLLDEPESFLDDRALEVLADVVSAHEGTVVWASPLERLPAGVSLDRVWRLEGRSLSEESADKLGPSTTKNDTVVSIRRDITHG